MKRYLMFGMFVVLLGTFFLSTCTTAHEESSAVGSGDYESLVALFKEWRDFNSPVITDGVPDYTAPAMAAQREELKQMQSRLAGIDPSSWPVSQQIDYHIVRAEMNGLEFDHRVLRPWSRNPCFYSVIYLSPSDVPILEGPWKYGTLCLWKYDFPLSDEQVTDFRMKVRAIPPLLDQARKNLTEDAKDLYDLAVDQKRKESMFLEELAQRVEKDRPQIAADIQNAKAAVDEFHGWLEGRAEGMTAPSGIGVENYNWYMKNVHLIPYTWEDQVVILERELQRSHACMKFEEHRNRNLPALKPPESRDEYQKRVDEAVDEFMTFLEKEEIMTVPDYLQPTLRRSRVGFIPPGELRDFFNHVDYHDALPLRCHGTHWFDLARIKHEPHPSPIRSAQLLYNIWDSRAEGLATGMEEMMMHSGLMANRPRAREIVYIMLANRAARGMGDLKMHSNEFTKEDAVDYAVRWTPREWLPPDGNTVWFDEQLYLVQPGYGTSYVVGKIHLEKLIADVQKLRGDAFTMKSFFDDFYTSGMIPLSLIRWEMTGLEDEINKLW